MEKTMPKYIDADALKELFLWECKDVCDATDEFYTIWGASQKLIEKIIDSAPSADVEPKKKWILVTDADNLPKKSTPCLVACNQWGGEIVRKATYLDSEKRFFEGEFDITEYVTHWMSSPEPPKEYNDVDFLKNL